MATTRSQRDVVERDVDRDVAERGAVSSDEDDFVEREAVEPDQAEFQRDADEREFERDADDGEFERDADEGEFERDGGEDEDLDEAPSPLEHATPDVELAEAQIAVGRPEPVDEGEPEDYAEPADEEELEDYQDQDALEDESGDYALGEGDGGDAAAGGRELARSGGRTAAPRKLSGNRLINFLQGSWRELQRVQWPDRRQVMQATGVVIGFVILAGLYLGAADTLASKLVNLILK